MKRNNLIAVVVDDDEDDLQFIVSALRETGAFTRIDSYNSGLDVLQYLSDTKELPDMIVADFKMPLLSGLGLLEKIKNDQRLAHIPVFIFSTSSYKQDIINCQNMGANNFITKPYDYKGFTQAANIIIDILIKAISPEPFHRMLLR